MSTHSPWRDSKYHSEVASEIASPKKEEKRDAQQDHEEFDECHPSKAKRFLASFLL